MPVVHLADMLNHAYRHGYAVSAFDVVSLDFLEGIMQAAEICRAPVILSLTEPHFEHYDFDLLMPAVVAAAQRAAVPVAIQLDHGVDLESAVRAIRAGCNGVTVNFSALPFPENRDRTRKVVEMARACGVAVEGDLSHMHGVEGDDAEKRPGEIVCTSPAEARAFVERTGVDCLSVSICGVHGRMRGKPALDFVRLAKINEAVGMPLVIHAGTGLTDDQCRRMLAHGVAKINYCTALTGIVGSRLRDNVDAAGGSYTALARGVRDAVRAEAERCIRLGGGGGRAAEVLTQCRAWREVEHVVLYNVSEQMSESAMAAMMRHGQEVLSAIPGVQRVLTGAAVRADAKYHRCWLVRFANQAVIESYRDHPGHVKFANEMFRPNALDRITIDYELKHEGY